MGFTKRKIENRTSPFLKGERTTSQSKVFFGPAIIDSANKGPFFSRKLFLWLVIGVVVLLYIIWGISNLLAPPKITILSPKDNFITEEKIVTIKGKVNERALVKINEQVIGLDNQNFFEEKISLSLGVNTIKISAKKKIGKENIIFRQIIVR